MTTPMTPEQLAAMGPWERVEQHLVQRDKETAALRAEVDRLSGENRSLRMAIERDRTTMAHIVTSVGAVFNSRIWLADGGRGSYEWDDDRYREEFSAAVEEIKKALEPLHALAADLKDSPRESAEVREARRNLEAENARLVAELATEAAKVAKMRADTIDACIAISRGCTDYGGGYRGTDHLHAYHHGMGTVTNCLEAFKERDLADTQVRVVHAIGISEAERRAEQEERGSNEHTRN